MILIVQLKLSVSTFREGMAQYNFRTPVSIRSEFNFPCGMQDTDRGDRNEWIRRSPDKIQRKFWNSYPLNGGPCSELRSSTPASLRSLLPGREDSPST